MNDTVIEILRDKAKKIKLEIEVCNRTIKTAKTQIYNYRNTRKELRAELRDIDEILLNEDGDNA